MNYNGHKSVETPGSKIQFFRDLETFPPLPPTFPQTMLIFLFLACTGQQRLHNIELGGLGYQRINARCR